MYTNDNLIHTNINIDNLSINIDKLIKNNNINDDKSKDWEFVDKIIYINLEERKEQIEEELNFLPKDKIIRFDGIKDKYGYKGCCESHIACLNLAINNNWKNVLILEDD